jgi:hypothetical protein
MLGMSYTVVVDQAVWHHTEADPKAHKGSSLDGSTASGACGVSYHTTLGPTLKLTKDQTIEI